MVPPQLYRLTTLVVRDRPVQDSGAREPRNRRTTEPQNQPMTTLNAFLESCTRIAHGDNRRSSAAALLSTRVRHPLVRAVWRRSCPAALPVVRSSRQPRTPSPWPRRV